ncbi:MAG: FAD:protein FMN transferase [Actinomycetota bacterium]
MAKSIFKNLMAVVLAVVLSTGFGCNFKTYSRFDQTREMMGTFVSIAVYAENQRQAESAMDAAFTEISQIESIATIFDERSEASLLNADGYIDNPSGHLVRLITESKNYHQISGGAFDITVQPILELWQAGLWKEPEEVQREMLDRSMELVGSDMIEVSNDRIEFEKENMKITLGGIAKGYAVDRALEVLKEEGIRHALVNAGGDIMTTGPKPDGGYWTIALENPDNREEKIAVLNVADKAVTTSGNYERYFDPEKEAHHIIDPRTGYSSDQCISTTIVSNSCMDADVLATSIFVLGPRQGIELVNRLDGVEALIIDNERNIHKSDGLSKYINN